MPDALSKTLAAVLGSLALVLSGSTMNASYAAPALAGLNASAPQHSQVIKVGDLWQGPGWGPAPYPVGCGGPACGAGWQTSGWGPAPYPAGCGGPGCGG